MDGFYVVAHILEIFLLAAILVCIIDFDDNEEDGVNF